MKEEDVKELKEDIKAILHILNGNGKIGLVGKVDILWHSTLFIIGAFIVQCLMWIRNAWK